MANTVQYTVQQLCDALGVKLPAEYAHIADDKLTKLACNVNHITKGGALFILGTNNEIREKRLEKAIAEGAKIVIIGSAGKNLSQLKQIPHIFADSVVNAVVRMAAAMRDKLAPTVVGVTGSLGKTTTKEMVYSVLRQKYRTAKSPGNQNILFRIFDNLQMIPMDSEFYVQEFGAGIVGASMRRNAMACTPNAGIITNISDPHLDVFGTRENILAEKLQMIRQSPAGSPAFLNYDDALLREVRLEDHPIVSYAVQNKEADYYADNIETFDHHITFDIVHGERRTHILLNTHGTHNIYNALVAAAVGEWFGLSQEEITEGLASFKPAGIRQSLTNIGGYQLYIDCYNTAPISLLGDIEILDNLPLEEGGKRIAVLGDIVRLGDQAADLHTQVGRKIAQSRLDIALCFGNEYARMMADAIREGGKAALYTSDRDELNGWLRGLITRKDIALFKGPVARLLSKSIDQVYGTSFHVSSEYYEWVSSGDYRMRVIFEKGHREESLAALNKYKGADEELTLPNTVNGVEVFCVGTGSFARNSSIQNVCIPTPIFNIASNAFVNCTKLSRLELPASLKVIDGGAFHGCTALTELTVPDGVIHIGADAFRGCTSLQTLSLPASVGYIGEHAFANCPNVVVRCPAGSYAHRYAQENGLRVELTD